MSVKTELLDIQLEQNHNQLAVLRSVIANIDLVLLSACKEQNIVYRTHEKLGEISMYPHFDEIHFRRYIGEDLERTDFLYEIWPMVTYRMDLVYSYKAYLSAYKNVISKMRGEK